MAEVDLSTIPQRAIIIAGGDATRWKNYLERPKHLIEIDGETLIHRTVRLLKENKITDIHIVAKDDAYAMEGVEIYIPKFRPENKGVDKFLNSKPLWLPFGRTIVIYGDVFFTDDAMRKIATENTRDWLLFARPYGSEITGCPWGECFAQSFYPEQQPRHEQELLRLAKLIRDGKVPDGGGIFHYRLMLGLDAEQILRPFWGDQLIRIDDFTDDFDIPADYDNWIERWNNK